MVEPVLNFFEERSYFQTLVNRSPNVTKNHLSVPVTVFPTYREWNIPIGSILTDNGREYCGTDAHPYELFLQLSDIEHRTTKVRSPKTNGFVERFNRTVKEEFIPVAFRKKIYTSISDLQDELDLWLTHYNYERPHRGYRNLGKRPFDTVNIFISKNKQPVRQQS